MKRILIYGLAPGVGGVEVIITNIVRRTSDDILYTILLSGDEKCRLYDGLGTNVEIRQITSWGSNRLKFRSELRKILSERQYDYIWINSCIMANRDVISISREYPNLKIILHSHGSSFEEINPVKRLVLLSMHKLNRRLYLEAADIAFMCSKRSGNWFYGKEFCDNGKAVLFKNGIDIEKFKFNTVIRNNYRHKLNIENKIVLINVGRLSAVKNQIKLLNVTAECVKSHYPVHLLIVGDGELKETLVKHTEELGIGNYVSFLGERSDVNCLYQAADIFTLPSFHEGLSIVTVEAQAAGLYCIVSTGVPEDVNITGKVDYLPVEASDKLWVESISRAQNETTDRNYAYHKIIEAGYDINSVCQEFKTTLKRYDK